MKRRVAERFLRDGRGSVAVVAAFALPVLLGMTALALEYGSALLTKAETQRVADMAAYAGAVAYARTDGTADLAGIGRAIAERNGVGAIQLEQVSLRDASGQGVLATITTEKPLFLARVLTVLPGIESMPKALDVRVTALAGMKRSEPACVLALDEGGAGITLEGGTSLTAEGCAVASNSTIRIKHCGPTITTPTLIHGSGTPPSVDGTCGGESFPHPDGGKANVVQAETDDPMAGRPDDPDDDHPAIAAADARMAGMPRTADDLFEPPIPAGQDIEFGYSNDETKNQAAAAGCIATRSGNTWTLSCSHEPAYNFGDITIKGGISLKFNPDGAASTVYNFSGTIKNSGNIAEFGPGVYRVAEGIIATGGTTTHFGTGTMNSFRIGRGPDGKAIDFQGTEFIFGDAMGTGSVFEIVGNIESGGGGCLALPAAEQHDIAGHVVLKGAGVFGPGVYTIDGYLHFRSGGSCSISGVDQLASGVTFVLSGKGLPAGSGACVNKSFCAEGGQSVRIEAPKSGVFENIAVIGPTENDSGALLTAGAGGSRISGLFYVPNGSFTMSGGASVGGGGSGCFQLIASEIALSGGTSAASECIAAPGASGATVRLLK